MPQSDVTSLTSSGRGKIEWARLVLDKGGMKIDIKMRKNVWFIVGVYTAPRNTRASPKIFKDGKAIPPIETYFRGEDTMKKSESEYFFKTKDTIYAGQVNVQTYGGEITISGSKTDVIWNVSDTVDFHDNHPYTINFGETTPYSQKLLGDDGELKELPRCIDLGPLTAVQGGALDHPDVQSKEDITYFALGNPFSQECIFVREDQFFRPHPTYVENVNEMADQDRVDDVSSFVARSGRIISIGTKQGDDSVFLITSYRDGGHGRTDSVPYTTHSISIDMHREGKHDRNASVPFSVTHGSHYAESFRGAEPGRESIVEIASLSGLISEEELERWEREGRLNL